MDFTGSHGPEEHTSLLLRRASHLQVQNKEHELPASHLSTARLAPDAPARLPHPLLPLRLVSGGAGFLCPPHALTSFSGMLTMAKVDPSASQLSLLLFQDISEEDKKKHLP